MLLSTTAARALFRHTVIKAVAARSVTTVASSTAVKTTKVGSSSFLKQFLPTDFRLLSVRRLWLNVWIFFGARLGVECYDMQR